MPEILFFILCGEARWPRWTKEMVNVARSPPSLHGRLYQKSQSLWGPFTAGKFFNRWTNQNLYPGFLRIRIQPSICMYSIYVYHTYRYTRYTGSWPLSRPAISHGQIYFYTAWFWVIRPWPRPSGNTENGYLWKAQFVVQMMQTKTGAQSLRTAWLEHSCQLPGEIILPTQKVCPKIALLI